MGARQPAPAEALHAGQDERLEVEAGSLRARVEGVDYPVEAGDVLEVPRGAVHQVWNESALPPARAGRRSPQGAREPGSRRSTACSAAAALAEAAVPGPLAFGVLVTEYRDVIRLAARPRSAALAALASLGRLRGYRAELPLRVGAAAPAGHAREGKTG